MALDTLAPQPLVSGSAQAVAVTVHEGRALAGQLSRWQAWFASHGPLTWSRHPTWLTVLERGLGHTPYCLEATRDGQTCGLLFLSLVRSWLFGRYLVSLPYLNYGGPMSDSLFTDSHLIDRAVLLADQLQVRHLELRQQQPQEHPALGQAMATKAHMRLALPATTEALWKQLPSKVRNQVRKGQKSELTVTWGGEALLTDFYDVFSRNMRDLGTPVFGRALFSNILHQFSGQAELCVVRAGKQPVAAALLGHGQGTSEVPSASALREFNPVCANMLLYWHLLERAVEKGQTAFDFGRSTVDGPTYRFKKQWGAEPEPATWQYYVRSGNPLDVRPDNPRYARFIRRWQRLPVWLTRWLGPPIVRGIP